MANTIGFGQAAVNNTIGFGQGAKSGSSFSNLQSLEFDGVDDFVDVGRITSLESASDFSISVWVKPTDFAKGRVCGRYVSGQFIYIGIASGGDVAFSVTSGVTAQINTLATLPLNSWVNISTVFDGSLVASERLKIYIDGVLQSTTVPNTPPTNTGSLGVGNWSWGSITGLAGNLKGYLDEAAIYDYPLTQQNVTEIYNLGTPSDLSLLATPPLSWWRFEGTGTTATDSGTGGNNGTLENGVIRSTDVPT